METIVHILINIIVHLVIGEQPRLTNLIQIVEQDAFEGREDGLTFRAPRTIHAVQELAHVVPRLDATLDLGARQVQLVAELRDGTLDKRLGREVLGVRPRVRRAHGEDVRNQIRVPHRHAPDHHAAPIVTADDDLCGAQLPDEQREVVGSAFIAVEIDPVRRNVGT